MVLSSETTEIVLPSLLLDTMDSYRYNRVRKSTEISFFEDNGNFRYHKVLKSTQSYLRYEQWLMVPGSETTQIVLLSLLLETADNYRYQRNNANCFYGR